MSMHIAIAARRNRLARQERDLCDVFRLADATAPARARTLAQLGLERREAFARLEAAGVLRAERRGWYLDEAALIARRPADSSRIVRIVVIVALVNLLAGLALVLAARG